MPALNMATDTQLVYRDVLLSTRSRGVRQEYNNVGTETYTCIKIFSKETNQRNKKQEDGKIYKVS